MPTESRSSSSSASSPDSDLPPLPLPLLRSHTVPPAPNRRRSSIDFLYDFAGSSWIAYGASSLLVIALFPSPTPSSSRLNEDAQTLALAGLSSQQVIHPALPAADVTADVISVSWCPFRPSDGEIAAAAGNCVVLFSPDSVTASGSFCWRQTACIMQSFSVEAIEWTGSGDGLIAAGIDVILWKRKSNCWEIAWKSKAEFPQALISATWYAEGLVATAANLSVQSIELNAKYSSLYRDDCARVSVYHTDGKSGTMKIQLYHPQPVTMIQWRPSSLTQSSADAWRDVLLTCCLDGSVRMWSEIDNNWGRKRTKNGNDHKSARRSFHVIAVIEINQCMKGTLGTDIFIEWAIELGSVVSKLEGDSYCLSSAGLEHEQIGKCDWLISLGPQGSLTFWAIHCLDDLNPLRFPRVTLWKKHDLMDFNSYSPCNSNFTNLPILVKSLITRSRLFGPPIECSLVQLLPDNSVGWSRLYTAPQNGAGDRTLTDISKNNLSCHALGVLNQDGHTGNILQLAVHPYCEIEVAVSLDSHGLLVFWSLPSISNCTLGMQMLGHPVWKPLGKINLQDLSKNIHYSCLKWAPSVLNGDLFLLLGYVDGIDCFLVKLSGKGMSISCSKIFTVPFPGHSNGQGPPDQLSAAPLPSTCEQSFFSNSFFLFGIWTKPFQALSWKVVLQSASPFSSNSGCGCDSGKLSISEKDGDVSSAMKIFHVKMDLASSVFPDSESLSQIISVSLTHPDDSVISIQPATYDVKYHMATGCSDGTLKLWKISHSESINSGTELLPWELVGMFTAHQGPVCAVSLSSCGNVATVSINTNTSSLHIWRPLCLIRGGNFLLENAISLNGPVVALNWLSIGNGHLLLAVCMPNELRIYSEKRFDKFLAESKGSEEMDIWCCIAVSHTYPVACNFLWGPKVTPVIIHKKTFSLFSQWLFIAASEIQKGCGRRVGGIDESMHFPIFTETDSYNTKELSRDFSRENGLYVSTICSKMFNQQDDSGTKISLQSLLYITDRLCESLKVYHPLALLQHLYSGNWKRAYVVLKHLVGAIKSNEVSATSFKSTESKKFCFSEIDLSRYFDEVVSMESGNKGLWWGQDISGTSSLRFQNSSFQFTDDFSHVSSPGNFSSATSHKSEIMYFIDTLEHSHDIDALRTIEKTQILAIVDLLGELSESSYSSAYNSLDKPARRFWVGVRFERLFSLRRFGPLAAEELVINSRLMAWAFQSDCQDNLLSSLLSANPSWIEMRNLGMGFWFTDASQLRTRMEKLARFQYLSRKNPKDCALLYLALNRLQVLAGLFKVSKDEKDKLLVGFLSRDFQEEKNKAAALKNAYVLMGRHQLELAVAFFLLGGDPSSAVTVCAKNLGDEQLALVICRLIEGNGGQLEHQLISNILLPNAIEKGDCWLASLLEWSLGNYSCSINRLLYSHMGAMMYNSSMSNLTAFSDPDIGLYCLTLATKSNLKNSIGEFSAMVLSKLATWMTVNAFKRCGLPLEALDCYSSSYSSDSNNLGSLSDLGNHKIFSRLLNPFSSTTTNWLLMSVAHHIELDAKLNLAMQFISKLLKDHSSWLVNDLVSSEILVFDKDDYHHEQQVHECVRKLDTAMVMLEQKYSLELANIANRILVLSYNKGQFFYGFRLLQANSSQGHDADRYKIASCVSNTVLPRLLLKSSQEISCLFAWFVVCCNLTNSILKLLYGRSSLSATESYNRFHHTKFCLKSLIFSLRTIRPLLKLYDFHEVFNLKIFSVLDLLECSVLFASSWFSGNIKGIMLMMEKFLNGPLNHQYSFEVIADELMKILSQSSELTVRNASGDGMRVILDDNATQGLIKQIETSMLCIPEDEVWQLIGVCVWKHLSDFVKHQLSKFLVSEKIEQDSTAAELMNELPLLISKLFITSMTYISSSLIRQLAFFLRQKVSKGFSVTAFLWLDQSSHGKYHSLHNVLKSGVDQLEGISNEELASQFQKLWAISVRPEEICDNFITEGVACFPYNSRNSSSSWKDMQKGTLTECDTHVSPTNKAEENSGNNTSNSVAESFSTNKVTITDGFMETNQKGLNSRMDITSFHNPTEVLKRNGELIEAICFNSLDETQVAVASNRKGLLFFKWKTEQPGRGQAEYIWSESDWPVDGWAGCESTPVPTYVSQGIGLGSKRGTHLGLGGATIGLGPLARPGRDLTGGGAFGIPGYAGIGASGLGWGEQEDFEEFADPPATISNISSRALSRHPCRPFFLVGSSNTHIYLWEFDKDRATATYGVLPNANIPPPYALASISALQFDYCGQRFASAALDGTISTWQLEVGGRSNVYPTESSICFSNHACDVSYVGASGSILAAAGCSANGVNVVVWDTLAPPVTSQASIVCHEGGARCLSIFDNDVGSGSVSPLIVTGGRSGDVGIHDFRFIATGKSKRNKNSSQQDFESGAMHDKGMLWYIPKAHLGSVTKVSTIPNTSLFLTGGKDGDVKLWDAKKCQRVCHWPKMHDRHTFIQPNSRSLGGVARAAVTDIQVFSHGFLTCGGDGSVKLVHLK